jgi:hypothetical protein
MSTLEARFQREEETIEVACQAVQMEMERQGIDSDELAKRIGFGKSGLLVQHMLKGNMTLRDLAHCAGALGARVVVRLEV